MKDSPVPAAFSTAEFSTAEISTAEIKQSQSRWLHVRQEMLGRRQELTDLAAAEFAPSSRILGTNMVRPPHWQPSIPAPLATIDVQWRPDWAFSGHSQWPGPPDGLPGREDGTRFTTYAEAMQTLAPPRVFENRSTYRLRAADLSGPKPALTVSRGTYFDGVNIGDAYAHEYAAGVLGLAHQTTDRRPTSTPFDLVGKATNMAVSCLTLRRDRLAGEASFPLHWRDPEKVAHAGGLTQVVPVGIFQALTGDPWNERNDCDVSRCLWREFAEELLGRDENYDAHAQPFDYDQWSFGQQIAAAQRAGALRTYHFGLGADPLTLAVDLLVVVVIDDHVYDDIFGAQVAVNAEGSIIGSQVHGGRRSFPFTAAALAEIAAGGRLQASGAAVLALAWEHRTLLLDG
jgi:hypothetical protein